MNEQQQSDPCVSCGIETPLLDEYGQFECFFCRRTLAPADDTTARDASIERQYRAFERGYVARQRGWLRTLLDG